ncbi:MAG: hypothetical protein QG602_476 [Verrucomicrobiota bacterium]|nr:hypothetical protein [Verrucomicrobiota bacterium]
MGEDHWGNSAGLFAAFRVARIGALKDIIKHYPGEATPGIAVSQRAAFNAATTLAGTNFVTSPPSFAICFTSVELV